MEFQWWVKPLIVAGCLAAFSSILGLVSSYPSLAQGVSDNTARISSLEESQKVIVANQRLIDEGVRNIQADSEFILDKTDEVLQMVNSTKQFKRPKVKPSQLRDPE